MRHMSAGRISTGIGLLLVTAAMSAYGWGGDTAVPGAAAAAANPEAMQDGRAGGGHGGRDVYGIVNLVPSRVAFRTSFNARGQAAFEYVAPDFRGRVAFLDGERVIDPLPPAATVSALGALNDRGEVALLARYLDPAHPLYDGFWPMRWTAARGALVLPVPYTPQASMYIGAINNRGEIVGQSFTSADGAISRAVRWTAANRVLPLPAPPGFGEATAFDINESNISIGYGTDAAGAAHGLRWDPAGRPTDLGTFGATSAVPRYINNRGDIAGMLEPATDDFQAFLWSPGRGTVRVGPNTVLNKLNEAGEQVGRMLRPGSQMRAYYFSRARGLVDLHPRALFESEANDINENGVIVGLVRRSLADQGLAYRWSRTGGAVDLNTRLLAPPSGLVVNQALAVAPNGDIIATSSAGLVLLRANGRGSDAPVLGPIRLPQPVLNQPVTLTLPFSDRNPGDRHSATVDWGDGNGPQPAAVREYRGRGEVRATHTFTAEREYNIVVRVTDSTGRSKVQLATTVIFPSGGPVLLGEGELPSVAAGPTALAAAGPMFRLAAPLATGGGTSAPFSFFLLGRSSFKGEQLERVSLNGNAVRLEGRGRLDGRPGYRFLLDAIPGDHANGGAARLAVRIMEVGRDGGRIVFEAGAANNKARAAQAAALPDFLHRGRLELIR